MSTLWHNATTNPPERLTDVLLAVRGQREAAEGFRADAGDYYYSTGHAVAIAAVYAWSELPACPEIAQITEARPADRPTLKPLRVRSVRLKGGAR